VFQQRHLAEEVAGSQIRDVRVLMVDGGRAGLDHEELVREIAFGDERLARGQVDLVGPQRDALQLFARQVTEQRQLLQSVGVHPSPSGGHPATRGRACANARRRRNPAC
jgi:hypothetical protein